MSKAPSLRSLNLSPSRFRQHPDSIAERINRQALARATEQLGRRRRRAPLKPQGGKQLGRTELTLKGCPLDTSWRLWDMFGPERDYRQLSAAERRVCTRARLLLPLAHRGRIHLDWEVAHDDARYQPMTPRESGQPDWRYAEGSPRHTHAETTCDGHRVHIDILSALKFGPGRKYHECRIFVDGRLAGRGGNCGCSLGFGGSDLPAVAAVGMDAAVTVDLLSEDPVLELWEAHLVDGRD